MATKTISLAKAHEVFSSPLPALAAEQPLWPTPATESRVDADVLTAFFANY
jgi:hypothetical protein